MLTDQLELVLITFNRADALRQTLERLVESPFAECRLTVLDNASSDATPQVCESFASRFPDLQVVRHDRNLGGGPNYLRAVELASKPYAWILADDDDFDFSHCSDVISAVAEGEVDLVCVGAPGREGWTPGRTTLGALVRAGARVHWVLTFVPSTIFRTDLFDERSLHEGYRMVDDLYPQFPFVRRMVERDASIQVSHREIVLRQGLALPSSPLYWLVKWCRCCATLPDGEVRRTAVLGMLSTRRQWVVMLGASIAQERLDHPERVVRELVELSAVLRGRERLALGLVAPLALVPRPLYKRAKMIIKWAGRGGEKDATSHSLDDRP